jgi:lactose/L-arabinose transport system permease protein
MKKNIYGRTTVTTVLLYTLLAAGLLVSLFPFYWMFISATKTTSQIFTYPPNLLPGSNVIANMRNLFIRVGFLRVVINSLVISVTYSITTILLCSLAGYSFAKFRFKGKNFFFSLILMTLMVPYQATLIPLFRLMHWFGWGDTYRAVILPLAANVFGIFLMRQNMLSIPDSLIEAARIDGAGEFGIFAKIVMPTVRPALSALTIYMFMFQWNNFMWPLIILRSNEMKTIPVALSGLIADGQVIDYGVVMSGTSVATIPIIILFLLMQREFISGILSGAEKG